MKYPNLTRESTNKYKEESFKKGPFYLSFLPSSSTRGEKNKTLQQSFNL